MGGAGGDLGTSLGSCYSCCCCFQPRSTAGNIWPVARGLQHPTGGWDAGSPVSPQFPCPVFALPSARAGRAGLGALPAGAAGSTGSPGSSRLSRGWSQPRQPPGRAGGHGRIPEPLGATLGIPSGWWSWSSSQPSGGLRAGGIPAGLPPHILELEGVCAHPSCTAGHSRCSRCSRSSRLRRGRSTGSRSGRSR